MISNPDTQCPECGGEWGRHTKHHDRAAALAERETRIAELEDACSAYAGDLRAIVNTLNRYGYPHHPEYPNDDEIIRRIAEGGSTIAAQRALLVRADLLLSTVNCEMKLFGDEPSQLQCPDWLAEREATLAALREHLAGGRRA